MNRNELTDRYYSGASVREPACCVDVTCKAKNLGGVTLRTVAEAVCGSGCHRVVEFGARRTVYDLRTNSANPVWQGWTS